MNTLTKIAGETSVKIGDLVKTPTFPEYLVCAREAVREIWAKNGFTAAFTLVRPSDGWGKSPIRTNYLDTDNCAGNGRIKYFIQEGIVYEP